MAVEHIGIGDGTEWRVALASDPAQWPSGPFEHRAVGRFREGRAEATFEHLPAGEYAIVAFVDLDGDGELDRTLLGMPREPIAYGNDATPRLGPPAFASCLVAVDRGSMRLELALRVE